jgi:hypothetical protein
MGRSGIMERGRHRRVKTRGRVRTRGLPFILGLLLIFVSGLQARHLVNSCPEVAGAGGGLNVVTPTFHYTVTNFDPSWFDTEHPEKAPLLFILTIGQNQSLNALSGKLRLRMIVEADTSRGKHAPAIPAMDMVSLPLDSSFFGRPLRSNEVFAFTWASGGLKFTESPFFDLVVNKRVVPEMDIVFRFGLSCENTSADFGSIATIQVDSLGGDIGRLRYVKTIQALYPGTQITNPKPVPIYTINPIFKVVSELFNNHEFQYPADEPKTEIYIYELQPGQTADDAMQGLEFAKIPLFGETPTAYPANLPRLEPGKTYVWRARAILRGPTTEYMYSNALYFKIDERLDGGSSAGVTSEISDLTSLEQQIKFGDDYAKRLMAALKIILGDNFEIFDLSRGSKVPAKGQIRLNGHPYSLEELERLAREFSQSRHSVTRLRFQ